MNVHGVTGLVGGTPLVSLARLGRAAGARILLKLESRGPTGSVKDRVALAMVAAAEESGELVPGGTIIEPTSGNTGIALAFVAAARGYRLVLTMPERMSAERIALVRLLGADVELTTGWRMQDAVDRAVELADETPGAVMLQQFENPANPRVHRETTGPEILASAGGDVSAFVAGVGTGGTITGVGHVLKEHDASVRLVAVEPAGAAVLSGRQATGHHIQGIGAGFVPANLDRDIVDEIMTVTDEEAAGMARRLAREEGILAGPSSGANLACALRLASRPELTGKTIVTVVCDSGERYLTGALAKTD